VRCLSRVQQGLVQLCCCCSIAEQCFTPSLSPVMRKLSMLLSPLTGKPQLVLIAHQQTCVGACLAAQRRSLWLSILHSRSCYVISQSPSSVPCQLCNARRMHTHLLTRVP
jgi:hypothetical protein